MPYGAPDNSPLSEQPNLAPETPRLEQVLHALARRIGLELRVALPVRVVALRLPQSVDVQPLLQSRGLNGALDDLPILQQVPVAMPQGQGYSIGLPVAVGDTGLCVFCDRNIDAFLASDGAQTQDPQDSRAHDLNDAVFCPGLMPAGAKPAAIGSDLVLHNGAMQVRLGKAGTLSATANGVELLSSLTSALQGANDAIAALAASSVAAGKLVTPQTLAGATGKLSQAHDNLITLGG